MKSTFTFLLFIPLFIFSQKKEIAFKTFTLMGNTCAGFQTASGSLIFVPSDAFKTEDGGSCNGVISIKYREFHSQTDMYYSGLNMIWDDNGKYRLLESVGMFEIQAWCGEKRLALKDEKSIQVRMKCRRNLDNLYSFIYSTTRKKWSKYHAPVMDFSFLKNSNKADSNSVWGSDKVKAGDSTWVEGYDSNGESWVYKTLSAQAAKLPEGFFKGVNIKNLGIFNYDGVIKDSLAVPMMPEVFVKSDTVNALNQPIYVFYEGRNTLVYYDPSDFAERFVLLKTKGIKMFTEFKDGSLACITEEETNAWNLEAYRGKKIRIKLGKVPAKPKNEKELASVTGLKTE